MTELGALYRSVGPGQVVGESLKGTGTVLTEGGPKENPVLLHDA